jgi:uncharacterized protein YodC (DUF2158 family)
MEFKIGDTVRLKSGGRLMTVDGYLAGNKLKCQCFFENNLQWGSFSPEALEKDDGQIHVG